MILDVDAGNTRIKWRCSVNDETLGYGTLLTSKIYDFKATIDSLGRPTFCRLSNVAGAHVQSHFETAASQWGARLTVAKSIDEMCGVTSGYREPSRLGVDRWLAVVAAYTHLKRACVVVDAGSAVTVDLVDDLGRHLGGYIVPGLTLMNRALFDDTDAGAAESNLNFYGLPETPGKTTDEAVARGILNMVLGLIRQARERLGDGNARIVMTGGDAELLAEYFLGDCELTPHLVLDGLALLGEDGAAS